MKDKYRRIQVIGYAGLSQFISEDKEHSSFIFRRFDRLCARNLLQLQSELQELEIKQDDFDQEDAQGDIEAAKRSADWELLKANAKRADGRDAQERVKLAEAIRAKVQEYQEAILRNKAVLDIQRPPKSVHDAFASYFYIPHPQSGQPIPRIRGASSGVYVDELYLDTMTMWRHAAEEDRFTTFLRNRLPWLFQRHSQDSTSGHESVGSLSEYRLQMVVAIINASLAVVMLFGAIFNLYYVQNSKKRLGLIAGYTIGFAFCIGLLTNARRSEIFSACAAYSAVLVVFVSGGLGQSGGNS